MAYSQSTTVRLERQPHRDAVIRVRKAYRRLLQSRQSPITAPAGTAGSSASAQEVRT
jgi:hypothetical protein